MDIVSFLSFLIFLVLNFFIVNCYRDFRNSNKTPQTYLYISVLLLLFNLINGFSIFIWEVLNDKLGFKKLMFLKCY